MKARREDTDLVVPEDPIADRVKVARPLAKRRLDDDDDPGRRHGVREERLEPRGVALDPFLRGPLEVELGEHLADDRDVDPSAGRPPRRPSIGLRDAGGHRPVFGGAGKFQDDPHWRDCLLFYEYFHGDNGAGLGASHQTGWTGIIARSLHLFATMQAEDVEASKEAYSEKHARAVTPAPQMAGAAPVAGR